MNLIIAINIFLFFVSLKLLIRNKSKLLRLLSLIIEKKSATFTKSFIRQRGGSKDVAAALDTSLIRDVWFAL